MDKDDKCVDRKRKSRLLRNLKVVERANSRSSKL